MSNRITEQPFCQTRVSGSTFVNADCFDVFPFIEDKSIDAIICDLPYGTTSCKWDSILPFDKLWKQYERIIKDNGAIILFGCEPFSSLLRTSNIKLYKYDWIWEKPNGSDPFQCKKRPMNNIENISIFSKSQTVYNPQMIESTIYKRKGGIKEIEIFGCVKDADYSSDKRYPMRVLKFNKEGQIGSNEQRKLNSFHPTQKPNLLMEYLVKTYTNEGDMVLDNTMGSGTTNLACIKLNRKSIGIEKEKQYYDVAVRRASEYCH